MNYRENATVPAAKLPMEGAKCGPGALQIPDVPSDTVFLKQRGSWNSYGAIDALFEIRKRENALEEDRVAVSCEP